jgi:hypothetical protein
MALLDDFAAWFTCGSMEGYPSNQRIVLYGVTAPEELSLEEFAEHYKNFICKKFRKKLRELSEELPSFESAWRAIYEMENYLTELEEPLNQ